MAEAIGATENHDGDAAKTRGPDEVDMEVEVEVGCFPAFFAFRF